MRIVVNDIVAVPNSGGVYSILTDFYNEVLNYSKLHKDVEWIFLVSGKFLKETDNIKIICFPEIKKSHLKRLLFELLNGKKIINSLKPDVYLSLQNTMTLGVNAKKWTYLHQPLPYQKEMKFSIFKRLERKMLFYKWQIVKFKLNI
ncbi:hypothetical protein [Levilactobacillus brevis]|uniref:hypothetical protein n=1 Tax=Levilactobacillus brevis TaxID=1580 RepID=UPI0020CEB8DA|nr:hypothetical protein [Levilactobacillus brevis]MCP9614140.1 hypothetical protein [Levilactobacillus brevis]